MSRYKAGREAKEAYDKYRRGDPIGDSDLLKAARYWQDVADWLLPLGDVFRLAAGEALRVSQGLNDYVSARKLTPLAESS